MRARRPRLTFLLLVSVLLVSLCQQQPANGGPCANSDVLDQIRAEWRFAALSRRWAPLALLALLRLLVALLALLVALLVALLSLLRLLVALLSLLRLLVTLLSLLSLLRLLVTLLALLRLLVALLALLVALLALLIALLALLVALLALLIALLALLVALLALLIALLALLVTLLALLVALAESLLACAVLSIVRVSLPSLPIPLYIMLSDSATSHMTLAVAAWPALAVLAGPPLVPPTMAVSTLLLLPAWASSGAVAAAVGRLPFVIVCAFSARHLNCSSGTSLWQSRTSRPPHLMFIYQPLAPLHIVRHSRKCVSGCATYRRRSALPRLP
ncbi:ABL167Cp [Eremothecium gossypii ATCC 10895]|uniref:ABL167Cp n=1 Tax=Eremothecium gossypii (strain ATCC 10895 / CBS 109.51 / FGSC 9923 / NRRL Y-1056) TaxID=284811 RepID=Q75E37_EREGS|nr:ABL167Cp [Eremothecium gossypii ATCC 10895]AAS50604.1 ABL167Cp [Eremothecium gossypii ATCC 10895]